MDWFDWVILGGAIIFVGCIVTIAWAYWSLVTSEDFDPPELTEEERNRQDAELLMLAAVTAAVASTI